MRQRQKPASASDESIAFSVTVRLVTCHRDTITRVQMATKSLRFAYSRADGGLTKRGDYSTCW